MENLLNKSLNAVLKTLPPDPLSVMAATLIDVRNVIDNELTGKSKFSSFRKVSGKRDCSGYRFDPFYRSHSKVNSVLVLSRKDTALL